MSEPRDSFNKAADSAVYAVAETWKENGLEVARTDFESTMSQLYDVLLPWMRAHLRPQH